ncbi:MAG: nitrogenase component 1 [Clostridia bacterium]
MRGLRKFLTPFAPDQSGAVSVFYEFGGIIVLCDAGGCTGHICGVDEPRWFESNSALFSAGLRDRDAILGRDDRLVAKLADAATKLDAKFAAIIGTPVPAVIGTDYHALKRMTEKKVDLPIMTVDTDGMELYDKGEEKAWLELFYVFAGEKEDVIPGRVGILGMTPQDISDLHAADRIRTRFAEEGKTAVCYGLGDGLGAVKKVSNVERHIVVSPAAWAAKYLERTYGTPYEVGYPLVDELIFAWLSWKKVLIDTSRYWFCHSGRNFKAPDARITVASWFMVKPELRKDGDLHLRDEEDYIQLVESGDFDVIYADRCMERMTPEFSGTFVDAVHFAVSGRLTEVREQDCQ